MHAPDTRNLPEIVVDRFISELYTFQGGVRGSLPILNTFTSIDFDLPGSQSRHRRVAHH